MKMQLKALAVSTALALSIGLSPGTASASGLPVIDVAAIAEAIKQYDQMVQQLENMRAQLGEAKKLYSSMTGDRGMQNLLSGEQRNVIPSNWQETLAQMGGGDISQLAQQIKQNAAKVDASTLSRILSSDAAQASNGFANSAASAQASAGEVYDNASERFARLRQLMDAIGSASDPKAIADLQARVGVESVMLQNEQIKMTALLQASQAQQAIQRQQVRELTLDKPGTNNTLPRVVR